MLSQKKHSDWKEQVIRMGVGNMGLKMGGGSREGGSRRPEKKSAPPLEQHPIRVLYFSIVLICRNLFMTPSPGPDPIGK